MWVHPWGMVPTPSQEVPWVWVDAEPHPDKGQLCGCDGHPAWLGQLLLRKGPVPSLMWFRSHPLLHVWLGGGRTVVKQP
jgi:hypothetical protein